MEELWELVRECECTDGNYLHIQYGTYSEVANMARWLNSHTRDIYTIRIARADYEH